MPVGSGFLRLKPRQLKRSRPAPTGCGEGALGIDRRAFRDRILMSPLAVSAGGIAAGLFGYKGGMPGGFGKGVSRSNETRPCGPC